MKLYDRWWEDFPEGLAFETRGVTVTETHLVNWAQLAGDWLPIHVDHEYASATQFEGPIAHGPLTMALALGLVIQANLFGDAVIAWLGIDELRAVKAVHVGDTIRVLGCVTEQVKTSKNGRGRVRILYRVHNQRDEIVMTFTAGFLMKRQPAELRHGD